MANKYRAIRSDELRILMASGSFFPEPSTTELIVTSATSTISILHSGVDARHTSARQQLNRWLAQWDFPDVKDIIMRLTSENEQHHQSARWELYLNSLFRSLGFSVEHEPLAMKSSGGEKAESPDFLIKKEGTSLLVEAVTISKAPKETEKKLWAELVSYLQKHQRKDFWIGITPIASSTFPPKMKIILSQINAYLDAYDPPVLSGSDPGEIDYFPICVDGWELELHAHRMPEGEPLDSFVGMWGNMDSGAITDTSDLRAQVLFKRSKYGKDLPHRFVIAVLENSFMGGLDETHRRGALFGEETVTWNSDGSTSRGRKANGIWNNGKIDSRLSGLLLLAGMRFGADELLLPEFWTNPYLDDSLHNLFPFTIWKAMGTTYVKSEGLEYWNPLST